MEIDWDVEKLEDKSGTEIYAEIKQCVADHNDGMKVTILYFGQLKNMMDLEKCKNFNLGTVEKAGCLLGQRIRKRPLWRLLSTLI